MEYINELRPDVLSINSINPWTTNDSSSRGTMISSSHIGQCLVVKGCTPRRCQSGTEMKFARTTFSLKFPCDAQIIRVIPKFQSGIGADSIRKNPSSSVIFENIHTKEVGLLELIRHSMAIDNKHQHFGFHYKFAEAEQMIYPGAMIPKDTIVADSPAVDDQGNYCYGLETNTAFMSVPGIIEDGIVVSESYLDRIQSTGFESRVASWGKKFYPLNLYGDDEHYKPFPDVGEKVREDGLLFALRPYDDLLGPIEMSPAALREPDYIFDKLIYALPNARVTDVHVHHNTNNRIPPTPVGMDRQTSKYYEGLRRYYTAILEVYDKLYKERRGELRLTPEFHRLIVEAMAFIPVDENPALKHPGRRENLSKRKIQKLYRGNDIDDWRVVVSFEYDVKPTIGFKLTDLHGGKGVICDIWSDSDMPVDSDGNRAEVIMDGDSTIKRMNIGRLYEQFYNAASRDVSNHVRQMMENDHQNGFKQAWDYLLGYYSSVSPKMYDLLAKHYNSDEEKKQHVQKVVEEGVYLWVPTDNPRDPIEAVKSIQANYPPTMGPVTYAGGTVTNRQVLIGSVYMIMLEKTGVDWSGVSSAKLQHFGIPARISNIDKHSTPGRNQPVRIMGESEVRLFNASVGSDVTADILDQSNNPTSHKKVVENILKSDQPTNIESVIDRKEVPLGNSRSLQFVKHIMECAGIQFVRVQDDPLRVEETEQKGRKR